MKQHIALLLLAAPAISALSSRRQLSRTALHASPDEEVEIMPNARDLYSEDDIDSELQSVMERIEKTARKPESKRYQLGGK